MGLENFTYSDNDDEEEEETTTEEESKDEEIEDEEQLEEQEENEATGLDAFSSENLLDKEEQEEERIVPWKEDFTSEQWNAKTEEEKVEYIRANYWPNYRPEFRLNELWKYQYVSEITCKCGDTFTIQEKGMCMTCGRTYVDHGKVVELVDEPQLEE